MTRRFVILNRATGHVVKRGPQEILRRQLRWWRELYARDLPGIPCDLAIELEPVPEAARRAGAI